jgi:tryptophanase
VQAASAAALEHDGPEPDLEALAARIFGPFRYVFTLRGRAAERALMAGLGLPPFVALAHPLFRTTQSSLLAAGGRVEPVQLRVPQGGSADVDLDWLARRLQARDVRLVYLEPGTNALGGWPLSLDNVERASQLCRQHGALLLLDCARLLANCVRLGLAPLEAAPRFTSLCDAFTVSCSKEFLVPGGALAAVRTDELRRRCEAYAFEQGTTLELYDVRARLAAGLRYVAGSPGVLAARTRQVDTLAARLSALGVSTVDPPGVHAVYVRIPAGLAKELPQQRALEALLYRIAGVRSRINVLQALGGPSLRLAVTIGRYPDATLESAAAGIASFLSRLDEAPRLTLADGEDIHDLFARYREA